MQTSPATIAPPSPLHTTPTSSAPSPTPSANPLSNSQHARYHSVRSDLHTAFHLLHRSPAARRFILTPPTPSADLVLLSTPRPSFTISTEEVQLGALPGRIALRYLGLPAFADTEGLSGGLVVTHYASRTHPLHHPDVMADVRVGRYVRDNATGEWCILTRNNKDRIVRLQYMRVAPHGARERIGITCSTDLFDRGQFFESVLFKCHDHEIRVCHRCACTRCLCRTPTAPRPEHPGLDTVAQSVLREGADDWVGTVRVTVVTNVPNTPLQLDIDDTMTVRSSYQPSFDTALASHLQRLAITETISQTAATIPAPISNPQYQPGDRHVPAVANPSVAGVSPCTESSDSDESALFLVEQDPHDSTFMQNCASGNGSTQRVTHPSPLACEELKAPLTLPITPPLSPSPSAAQICATDISTSKHPTGDGDLFSSMPWLPEISLSDIFGRESFEETADHFLVPSESPFMDLAEEVEYPMLPADPSTLPAGVGTCLDGMDVDELDDDCFSLMTSERDTRSVSSALSTAGSDYAPPVDSVPMPGDDVLDAMSALNLSSPALHTAMAAPGGLVPPMEGMELKNNMKESNGLVSRVCTSPINAPLVGVRGNNEEAVQTVLSSSAVGDGRCGRTVEGRISTSHTAAKEEEELLEEIEQENDKPTLLKAETGWISGGPTAAHNRAADSAPVAVVSTNVAPVNMVATQGALGMLSAGVAMTEVTPGLMVAMPVVNGIACGMGAGGVAGGAGVVGKQEAPRLAPRPEGMAVTDQLGLEMAAMMSVNQQMVAVRLQAMEKERKAEERRKKNRQAAARSNAKKKDLMDGIRVEIKKSRQREKLLMDRRARLQLENEELRSRVGDNPS